jgi:hypothetical protein
VLECGRRAIDPRAELSIRHALPVIDDGLPVWMGRGPLLQDLIEGLSAPVAGARVTLDEVWRQMRLEDRHDGLLKQMSNSWARL